jgi:hypothetical protein
MKRNRSRSAVSARVFKPSAYENVHGAMARHSMYVVGVIAGAVILLFLLLGILSLAI